MTSVTSTMVRAAATPPALVLPSLRRPPRYLASTTTRKTRCRHCRATILVGLAEGLRARVDVQPLEGVVAEVDAQLERRWTYTLATNGELIQRDAPRIAAGLLSGPIHAEHRCAIAIVRKGR